MVKDNQAVAAILIIIPLLLEGRLGINVSHYFHSSYTIGTEEHKWNSTLDKMVPTGIDNYLEEIDRHWIQYTYNFTMRNKQYKDKHRIMKDGNESLQTMGLNTHF